MASSDGVHGRRSARVTEKRDPSGLFDPCERLVHRNGELRPPVEVVVVRPGDRPIEDQVRNGGTERGGALGKHDRVVLGGEDRGRNAVVRMSSAIVENRSRARPARARRVSAIVKRHDLGFGQDVAEKQREIDRVPGVPSEGEEERQVL